MPDISELGLHVQANLERMLKQKLEVWVDFLNLLALRTPTAYIQQDGPFYGRTVARMDPMSLRLGLRFRY
jgi:hypothetical protein